MAGGIAAGRLLSVIRGFWLYIFRCEHISWSPCKDQESEKGPFSGHVGGMQEEQEKGGKAECIWVDGGNGKEEVLAMEGEGDKDRRRRETDKISGESYGTALPCVDYEF